MNRITTLALLILLLSSTACVRRTLAPTFAKVYRNILAAQVESRSSRALAPVKGDESRRIVRSYYQGLTGDGKDDAGSSGGGGGNISSTQTAPGPSPGGPNPFAFKVR